MLEQGIPAVSGYGAMRAYSERQFGRESWADEPPTDEASGPETEAAAEARTAARPWWVGIARFAGMTLERLGSLLMGAGERLSHSGSRPS